MPHQQVSAMTVKRFTKEMHKRKPSVLALASSYNQEEPCEFFRPYDRGSFNLCYFVHFPATDQRWVVRFLMKTPDMAYPYAKRVESEVATMKLIFENTTIPVPKIHGYSLDESDGRLGLSGYIIMDFCEGRSLYRAWRDCNKQFSKDQTQKLLQQFADIYVQLRRLEFDACGTLGFLPDGQVGVVRGPHTVGVNLDQSEGLDAFALNPGHCDARGRITTAKGYFAFLFKTVLNSWARLPNQDENEASAKQTLYRLQQVWDFIEKQWRDPKQNNGPFVLAHGDLHCQNILVDDDLNFVAVLDWEWSHVVPAQFFTPPPWLEDSPLIWSAPADDDLSFDDAQADFQEVVQNVELDMYGSTLLADELACVPGRVTAYLPHCLADVEHVSWWGRTLLDKDSGIQTPASMSDVEDIAVTDEIQRFMAEDQSRWKIVHSRAQNKTLEKGEVLDFDVLVDVCRAIGFPLFPL